MGDEALAQARKYGVPPPFSRAPPDLDKARAERRANVARNIGHGLISETPAARTTDPETSHQAIDFMLASGARATNQKLVLDCVCRLPGLTYHAIAVQTGLERHEVMKRLGDLQGESPPLVRKGAPRAEAGGRACSTWWPAEWPR